MNRIFLSAIITVALFSSAFAAPTDAPFIDGRIEALQKRITEDLQSGKLSKVEGDDVQRELNRIKKTEDHVRKTGTITPKTRADLRRDLDKLENDIERKEQTPKPSPSPQPSSNTTPTPAH